MGGRCSIRRRRLPSVIAVAVIAVLSFSAPFSALSASPFQAWAAALAARIEPLFRGEELLRVGEAEIVSHQGSEAKSPSCPAASSSSDNFSGTTGWIRLPAAIAARRD